MRHELEKFFEELRSVNQVAPETMGPNFGGLKEFLGALEVTEFPQKNTSGSRLITTSASVNYDQLSEFFLRIEAALNSELRAGSSFNPWEAMRTGRKEVRCCEVLSWLLKPSASHGLGVLTVNGLLSLLRARSKEFKTAPPWINLPEEASQRCIVDCETPAGPANFRRLDISITDHEFEVVIEAKVGAREGEDQVRAYCRSLDERIGDKLPWLLVYLTPDGAKPESAGEYIESRVVAVSWRELAQHLTIVLWPFISKSGVEENPGVHARNYFVRTVLKNMKSLSGGKA